jgi:P27 family predicted phage terminase small subunit
MRGRKPVPTVLRIARGNPHQHKISDDEPTPSTAIDLAAPELLATDADAKRAWDELAPMLHRLGLLTEVDRAALLLYCATFAHWQRATRHLQRYGLVIKRKRKAPMPSPYVAIANQMQAQCRALLIEFGLTPVSRTRVHGPKHDAPDREEERFFGSGPRNNRA